MLQHGPPGSLCSIKQHRGAWGGAVFRVSVVPVHEVVGFCNNLCPIMLALELWQIPRQKHTIIDGPSKLLEPLLIMHIHQSRCCPHGLAGVYGLASPLCAAERGKRQDLIGNNALPIKVIYPHSSEHMEQLIKGI